MSQSIRISEESYKILHALSYYRGVSGARPFTAIGLIDEMVQLCYPMQENPNLYEWKKCETHLSPDQIPTNDSSL